jgi:hypothetical protein
MIEFLAFIFVKHYVVDFIMQTDAMVKGKGIYGNRDGILHSLQHAIGTLLVAVFLIANPFYWVALPVLDFVFHYHIDYLKMKYGCRDITNSKFWSHMGLDQLAHYLTYLLMVTI